MTLHSFILKGKASVIIYMGKFPDWIIRDIAVFT